jgi:hypothetical protein
MKLLSTTIAFAALAAFATPALAQATSSSAAPPVEAAPPTSTTATPPSTSSTTGKHDEATIGQAFMAADKDKSGALTLTEVKSANAGATEAEFNQYDANKDRQLSMAEFGKWTSDVHASTSKPG